MQNNKNTDLPINELTQELVLTYRIYEGASHRIHNQPMALRLEQVNEVRKDVIRKLMRRFSLPQSTQQLSGKQRLRLLGARLGMWVDSWLIRRNEREILTPCVRQEERLMHHYRDLLKSETYGPFAEDLLSQQLMAATVWHSELEETREAYNFQKQAA